MKKTLLLTLILPLLSGCGFGSSSSSSSSYQDPNVPHPDFVTAEHRTDDPIFGEITIYTIHDGSRICDERRRGLDNHFIVRKYEDTLNSSDYCDRCGKAWRYHAVDR